MEEELYNSARSTRPSERVVPGRIRHDYESEAAVHAPPSRRRQHYQYYDYDHHQQQKQQPQQQKTHHQYYEHHHQQQQQYEPQEEEPRLSVLAGLGGPGRGMNRVVEWAAYVEPGVPDGEGTIISV